MFHYFILKIKLLLGFVFRTLLQLIIHSSATSLRCQWASKRGVTVSINTPPKLTMYASSELYFKADSLELRHVPAVIFFDLLVCFIIKHTTQLAFLQKTVKSNLSSLNTGVNPHLNKYTKENVHIHPSCIYKIWLALWSLSTAVQYLYLAVSLRHIFCAMHPRMQMQMFSAMPVHSNRHCWSNINEKKSTNLCKFSHC